MIENKKPVGDICTNYFDINGDPVVPNENLLIVASAQTLKSIPRVLGIAGGTNKAQSLIGAIRSGIITDIITDESTAKAIIRFINKKSR